MGETPVVQSLSCVLDPFGSFTPVTHSQKLLDTPRSSWGEKRNPKIEHQTLNRNGTLDLDFTGSFSDLQGSTSEGVGFLYVLAGVEAAETQAAVANR